MKKKILQVEAVWFVCRFDLCISSLQVWIFTVLSWKKSMFHFSHGATNYIFRLLIYCNIPSSEKSESHWETSSVHTWQSSVASKPTRIPNPQLLPSHKHTNITWCFSHCWMLVAGNTEGLCSFRQWGNVGLPLGILCLAPIFPTGFSTPSSFPLVSSAAAWDLFAQALFLLPLLAHMQHTMPTMCRACIWLPTSLRKPATRLSVAFGILWLRWFIPHSARWPGILVFRIPYDRDLCQANVHRDQVWLKTSS